MSNTTPTVIDLDVEVNASDVVRSMGARGARSMRPALLEGIERELAAAREILHPRAAYVVREVTRRADHRLDLADSPPFCGPIAGFLQPARRVAVFVLTVGPELEQQATACMTTGEVLRGFTLDAIGSAVTDLAVDRFAEHLGRQEAGPDEAVTPNFSPGYCGLSMDQQTVLFSIVDGGAVGVELNDSFMMHPVKSVSGLLGIGDRAVVTDYGVPCRWCNLAECKMRRA